MIDADISERRSIGHRLGRRAEQLAFAFFWAAVANLLLAVGLPAPIVVVAVIVASRPR